MSNKPVCSADSPLTEKSIHFAFTTITRMYCSTHMLLLLFIEVKIY